MSRVTRRQSPLDEAPIPPRKWEVTFISEWTASGYTTGTVYGDTLTQAVEFFKMHVGDPVRIVSAVRR